MRALILILVLFLSGCAHQIIEDPMATHDNAQKTWIDLGVLAQS